MSLTSGFFDAMEQGEGNYDRVYTAAEFAHYFSLLVGNGVFPSPDTGLNVLASDPASMTVKIGDGSGWINGYFVTVAGGHSVTLEAASGAGTRIDSIIMQWNSNDRKINIIAKSGTASGDPKPVDLQRDAELWELELAQITVGAGVSSVDQTKIKDMRADSDRCGLVTALLKGIDPSTFLKQSEAEFNKWFQTIMNKISSEDVAGSLLKMITEVDNREKEHYSSIKSSIDSVKTGALQLNDKQIQLTPIGNDVYLYHKRMYGQERTSFPTGNDRTATTFILGDRKHFLKITSKSSERLILYSIDDIEKPIFTLSHNTEFGAVLWSDNSRFILYASGVTATLYIFRYDNSHIEQIHSTVGLQTGSSRNPMSFKTPSGIPGAFMYDYSYNNKLVLFEYYGNNNVWYPTLLDLNTYSYTRIGNITASYAQFNQYKDKVLYVYNELFSSSSSVSVATIRINELDFNGSTKQHDVTLNLLQSNSSVGVTDFIVMGDNLILNCGTQGLFVISLLDYTVKKIGVVTSKYMTFISENAETPSTYSSSYNNIYLVFDHLYSVDMHMYSLDTMNFDDSNIYAYRKVTDFSLDKTAQLIHLVRIPNTDIYCQALNNYFDSIANVAQVKKIAMIGGDL